jgi:hypothetical protein
MTEEDKSGQTQWQKNIVYTEENKCLHIRWLIVFFLLSIWRKTLKLTIVSIKAVDECHWHVGRVDARIQFQRIKNTTVYVLRQLQEIIALRASFTYEYLNEKPSFFAWVGTTLCPSKTYKEINSAFDGIHIRRSIWIDDMVTRNDSLPQ